jgi:hypothetical protein
MLKRCTITSEQDYYALLVAAAVVLTSYRALLNHPALDLSPAPREEHERDVQAPAECLPEKARLAVEQEVALREVGLTRPAFRTAPTPPS